MLAVLLPRSTLVHCPQFPDPPLRCFLPSVLNCLQQAQEASGEQAAGADEVLQSLPAADGLEEAGPSEVGLLCCFPCPILGYIFPSALHIFFGSVFTSAGPSPPLR